MDVQGAERDVIEGASNILGNVHYCYVEYGETFYEGGMSRDSTISIMKDRNFVLVPEYSDKGAKGNILFKNLLFRDMIGEES
jgi:hypothetical protein